ncbi:MAG: restriction endonuclease subunit S [Patescibacteria group bacterium]
MQNAAKIKTFASIITGYHFRTSPSATNENGIGILQAQHIDPERNTIQTGTIEKIDAELDTHPAILQQNDIVIVARGTSPGSYKASVVDNTPFPVIASSSLFVIRLQPKAPVTPVFLSMYLNLQQTQQQLFKATTGSAVKSLQKSGLLDLEIPLVDIETQVQCMQFQSSIQRYKDNMRRKTLLLEEIFQQYITTITY